MSKPFAVVGASAVLALALAAGSVARAAPGARPYVQKVRITIRAGDRVTEPNIALAPGLPVRMTVVNHTHEFHTFTVPGLKVSELIRPAHGSTAGVTTFTFTPQQWGAFTWRCLICPSGRHGRPHAMGGVLYLITDPAAVG